MAPRSPFPWTDNELAVRTRSAVQAYWKARFGQSKRQKEGGVGDTGRRSEVTGGQHLNAFVELLCEVIRSAGFDGAEVRFKSGVTLPGYYRPQKKWDIVVERNGRLCAVLEMKSQVGPSFGNNFNNRSEEAIGSSADLWLAYREGAVGKYPPWVGYLLLVEEAPGSTDPVKLSKAAFAPMPIFNDTSYVDRYGILCRRLILERNYTAASLIVTPRAKDGRYTEPVPELGMSQFLKSLFGHLVGAS